MHSRCMPCRPDSGLMHFKRCEHFVTKSGFSVSVYQKRGSPPEPCIAEEPTRLVTDQAHPGRHWASPSSWSPWRHRSFAADQTSQAHASQAHTNPLTCSAAQPCSSGALPLAQEVASGSSKYLQMEPVPAKRILVLSSRKDSPAVESPSAQQQEERWGS